jgi:NADPH2:quinone reductase
MVAMHAIRLHEFGPAGNLVLDELPDLEPAAGEVRVAVEAAGIHLLDTTLRRGDSGTPIPLPELPTIPGREVAGVVDRVGAGVDAAWVGRRVAAHLGPVPGGYAEQAVTVEASLIELADATGFPDAIAGLGTGRTAMGILELEPPEKDDVVWVPSAAGGLGWFLVQAAVAIGATVVAGAGSAGRVAALEPLGADLVVDYSEPDWAERVRERTGGLTLAYDGVGGDVGRQALELLRPGGRLVLYGYASGSPTRFDTDDVITRGISVGWSLGPRLMALPGGIKGLAERALERVAAGDWSPLVTTYPLAEAARAHRDLEQRRTLGKAVLVVPR